MVDLNGRHILVIGGSRGIGAATALTCAEQGARVSIFYRSRHAEAQEVVSRTGGVAIAADVTSETEIVGAFKELETIDGLVISAGIFEGCSVEEMSLDFWKRTMDTNLTATFLAVREFVKARGDSELPGSIVIITSTAGQRGSAVFSAYATSKGAQLVFMRSMAKELAPRQIRVNCIAPAWTETEMADASLTDLGRESVIRDFPLGRIGQPADVANAAAFLLSDAAEFITGSTITVDGGFDMRG